jgi:hypothetical protein
MNVKLPTHYKVSLRIDNGLKLLYLNTARFEVYTLLHDVATQNTATWILTIFFSKWAFLFAILDTSLALVSYPFISDENVLLWR